MVDNVGTFIIKNGGILTSDNLGYTGSQGNEAVYEVIRIIDTVPLFIEDHYIRLENSMGMLGLKLEVKMDELQSQIRKLVDANKLLNCNIKVNIYAESGVQSLVMYISKSYYPGKAEIENGVKVSFFNWERKNPNIKITNTLYKQECSKTIAERNVFELLLVKNDGIITEGSKSNVFFLKGSKVYTSPGEYVLKGITRKYIIDTCRKLGFEVIETLLDTKRLNDIEGLFISGTSIKVLPVAYIDDKKFNSSRLDSIIAIRDEFDRFIDGYISKHKA